MKESRKFYIALWATLLVLFNVIAFVSVGWIWFEKYTPSFWCGYIFIMLSFAVNLLCALPAFSAENMQKSFYRMAYLRISYGSLIAAFVLGGLCMLASPAPGWLCVLICAITGTANFISYMKAKTAVELVSDMDDHLRNKTQQMMILRADAQSLVSVAADETTRQAAKKVSDAFRFSDPVSNPALAEMEQQLQQQLDAFGQAIRSGNDVETTMNSLLQLLEQRNNRTKAMK